MSAGVKETVDLTAESDRGCVIVGAAILDDFLKDQISAVFGSNGMSNRYITKAFDGSGPLANFSSKILIARGFGLIHDEVFEDMMAIRKLRNEFAHTAYNASFDNPNVVQKIKTLNLYPEASKEYEGKVVRGSVSDKVPTTPHELAYVEAHFQAQGYMRLQKAIFCAIIYLIQIRILKARVSMFGGS